jgi:hypothetical protein
LVTPHCALSKSTTADPSSKRILVTTIRADRESFDGGRPACIEPSDPRSLDELCAWPPASSAARGDLRPAAPHVIDADGRQPQIPPTSHSARSGGSSSAPTYRLRRYPRPHRADVGQTCSSVVQPAVMTGSSISPQQLPAGRAAAGERGRPLPSAQLAGILFRSEGKMWSALVATADSSLSVMSWVLLIGDRNSEEAPWQVASLAESRKDFVHVGPRVRRRPRVTGRPW